MKESVIYILLIGLLAYVLYSLWFHSSPALFIQDGIIVVIALIAYNLLSRGRRTE